MSEGVWATEHKASFFSDKVPDVAKDEVDDMIKEVREQPCSVSICMEGNVQITDKFNTLMRANATIQHLAMKDDTSSDSEDDSVATETLEEKKERERKEDLLRRGYSDYMEFEKEQKQHKR